MMKRFVVLFFVWMSFFSGLFAQNCSCKDNMKWVSRTIEQNDAGFSFYFQKIGKEAYEKMKENYLRRSETIRSKFECLQLINDYLNKIRSGHIGLMFTEEGLPWEGKNNPEKIKKLYWEAPRYPMDNETFEKYLQHIKNSHGPEGIWKFNKMEIGIIYDKNKKRYIGFILSSSSPYWQPGHIILELSPNKNGTYQMMYYQRQRIKKSIPAISIKDGKYILTYQVNLKKLRPALPDNPDIEAYLHEIEGNYPSLKELSNNTLLLRIPSFSPEIKPALDSIYARLYGLLPEKAYLIIDLRNNGGGLDVLYQSLLPLLYTNPVRMYGVEFLSTPLNNARMEKFIKDTLWPVEVREWARKNLKKLQANQGEFVNLENKSVTEFRLDSIYSFPKKVAVMANKGSGSSTEQFLLAAKQSKKVKIFGTPTAGSLDVSNLNWTSSPCGEYTLFYAISRSLRIPGMPIDNIGVQPDYYLDNQLPPYQWTKYTQEILEYLSGKR